MKSRINRILDNLEKMIGVFGVSFLGMVSYLFINIDNLSNKKIQIWVIGAILVVIITIALVIMYQKYFKQLKD